MNVFILLSPLFATLISAQSPIEKAEAAFQELQAFYNTTTGIWNTCGWWNGANCMTVVADLAAVDASILAEATSIFATTYQQAPAVNPMPAIYKTNSITGFEETHYGDGWPGNSTVKISRKKRDSTSVVPAEWLDGYYDDDAWWALAWIAAYDVTQNQTYLALAEGIFQDMTQGGPTNCSNGGIYWNTKHSYVNAIANELFFDVAAHLANRVPADSKDYYVNSAQNQLAWFQQSGMINADNNINDGLTADCKNNGQTVWSYNQGVILGGLVELNKAAPNTSYLDLANTIANAAITNLTDENMIVHDTCEPKCGPDGTQFKGIFIRNLALLREAAPQETLYSDVIKACAGSIWTNDRDASNNSLSVDWSGPLIAPANASTHSSAMDALVADIGVEGGCSPSDPSSAGLQLSPSPAGTKASC
ncbi:MAG: hypothetical protein M1828_000351 [Chrysothrix sp. TS-e1954]|nr:MAG: hypothetical protein M1828_000351 [Chrysothrix sp. TS-e1954]